MQKVITSELFSTRLRQSITFAWKVFMRKAGNGLLPINKEASMQLQYAYILQQVLPLVVFKEDERVELELETGINNGQGIKEVDLLLKGSMIGRQHIIAVEMKCYKTYAASGGLRGATDIFMKDIYEDLNLLESYISSGNVHRGVLLVMNDLERLVSPKKKDAKCWDYDISNNTHIENIDLSTPIGGKDISIHLDKAYDFTWEKHGAFWFMEIEGQTPKRTRGLS